MSCTLSIDPGGTSGMAVHMPTGKIMTFVCKSPKEVYAFIFNFREILTDVVIENFSAQLIGRYGLETVRIVGGVYALCCVYEINHVVQMPQMRYSFQKEAEKILRKIREDTGIRYVVHES